MMGHRRYRRALDAYVDGELSGAELTRMQAHLAGCGTCARELQHLEELRGLLRQAHEESAAEAAPALWPGVRARIARGRPPRSFMAWIRGIWEASWERPRLSLAGALVTAFLVLSTGYWMWEAPVVTPPVHTVAVEPGEEGVDVQAVDPEEGVSAMVLTTSGEGLKVIWVMAQGQL